MDNSINSINSASTDSTYDKLTNHDRSLSKDNLADNNNCKNSEDKNDKNNTYNTRTSSNNSLNNRIYRFFIQENNSNNNNNNNNINNSSLNDDYWNLLNLNSHLSANTLSTSVLLNNDNPHNNDNTINNNDSNSNNLIIDDADRILMQVSPVQSNNIISSSQEYYSAMSFNSYQDNVEITKNNNTSYENGSSNNISCNSKKNNNHSLDSFKLPPLPNSPSNIDCSSSDSFFQFEDTQPKIEDAIQLLKNDIINMPRPTKIKSNVNAASNNIFTNSMGNVSNSLHSKSTRNSSIGSMVLHEFQITKKIKQNEILHCGNNKGESESINNNIIANKDIVNENNTKSVSTTPSNPRTSIISKLIVPTDPTESSQYNNIITDNSNSRYSNSNSNDTKNYPNLFRINESNDNFSVNLPSLNTLEMFAPLDIPDSSSNQNSPYFTKHQQQQSSLSQSPLPESPYLQSQSPISSAVNSPNIDLNDYYYRESNGIIDSPVYGTQNPSLYSQYIDNGSMQSFDSQEYKFMEVFNCWKILSWFILGLIVPPFFFIVGYGADNGLLNDFNLLKMILNKEHRINLLEGFVWNIDLHNFRRLCIYIGIIEIVIIFACMTVGFAVGLTR